MLIEFNQIMFNLTQGYYRYIGSGSGRKVFDLGNGYVIKVAKNRAGIAQNKSEYKISLNNHSNLFAKVIGVSNNFVLLIMERAYMVPSILYVWKYFDITSKKELIKSKELQNIMKKYNLLLADLGRKSSWGIINGRPVIVDYGFTREVKERYYSFEI
ncbi:hypothetical protein UT300005_10020 [Clostridium sp. CTA-5]